MRPNFIRLMVVFVLTWVCSLFFPEISCAETGEEMLASAQTLDEATTSSMTYFSISYYFNRHNDVKNHCEQSQLLYWDCARDHFERYGRYENRLPSEFVAQKFVSESSYFLRRPDVAQAVRLRWLPSAMDHFFRYGFREIP